MSILPQIDTLKITAYEKRERLKVKKGSKGNLSFETPVSIEDFSQYYSIKYKQTGGIGTKKNKAEGSKTMPRKLQINILLDNTILFHADMGTPGGVPQEDIVDKVNHFLSVCYLDENNHNSPQFLVLTWGKTYFTCKLGSCDVKYSLFDTDGNPLRANIKASFVEDSIVDDPKAKIADKKNNITHVTMKAGDSLTNIAQEAYGSSKYHLALAKANGINHIRNIKPDTKIKLFPLEELKKYF